MNNKNQAKTLQFRGKYIEIENMQVIDEVGLHKNMKSTTGQDKCVLWYDAYNQKSDWKK